MERWYGVARAVTPVGNSERKRRIIRRVMRKVEADMCARKRMEVIAAFEGSQWRRT